MIRILNEEDYRGQVDGFLSSWSYNVRIGDRIVSTPAYVYNGDADATRKHTHPYRADMVPVGTATFCGYWRENEDGNIEPALVSDVEDAVREYPRSSERALRYMRMTGYDGTENIDWALVARNVSGM